jgi:hypothetical protein
MATVLGPLKLKSSAGPTFQRAFLSLTVPQGPRRSDVRTLISMYACRFVVGGHEATGSCSRYTPRRHSLPFPSDLIQ